MRSGLDALLSAILVVIATLGLVGQVKRDKPDHLIARLSYPTR